MKLFFIFLSSSFAILFISCKEKNSKSMELKFTVNSNQQKMLDKDEIRLLQKIDLGKIYLMALNDFITSSKERNNSSYDTIFIYKRKNNQSDDFPDILLPNAIDNIQIKLVSSGLEKNLAKLNQKNVFINLMGWVEQQKAEFIFVVFKENGVHDSDYFIEYQLNKPTSKYQLTSIEFENYLSEKPKRISIYKAKISNLPSF